MNLFIKDSEIHILKKMIELCFLGTGGSVATVDRDNTSFLLNCNERLVLIDCPGGVFQKTKRLDLDPRQVKAIFVTHVHPDHIYGLPSFVHSLMLDEGIIHLFGSVETVQFCKKLLDLFHLRDEKIKTRIEFVSLHSRESFEVKDVLAGSCLEVPHSPSSLAFLFRFNQNGKELVYSGDTSCDRFLFQEAAEKDYLIHDCSAPSRFFKNFPSLATMHTHSLELGEQCAMNKIKCLIPCHFFGELDFSLNEIEEEIKHNFKGKLIIPQDFQRIHL